MRVYEKPVMEVEVFEANEYVAACLTGTLACTLPRGKDGIYTEPDTGLQHGTYCASATEVSVSDGTGYESVGGVVYKNRPIWGVTGYNESVGSYNVTWTSTDGYGNYSHTGTFNVTYVDTAHPNHS